jgi:hypothetical protein
MPDVLGQWLINVAKKLAGTEHPNSLDVPIILAVNDPD